MTNLSDLSRGAVQLARLVQALPEGEHMIRVRKRAHGVRWEVGPAAGAQPCAAPVTMDLTLDKPAEP